MIKLWVYLIQHNIKDIKQCPASIVEQVKTMLGVANGDNTI